MHKYLWRKVSHHDTDTFIKFHFKKSKNPKNNGSIQVWAKCCINWSFRHIFSTRVASPLYSSQNPGKRKHFWDKIILSLWLEHTKNPPRQKDVQLTNTALKKKRYSETKPASPFLHCIIGSSVEKENCLVFSVFLGFVKRLSLEHWN